MTIKDIARSVGLSTAAVSQALRPRSDSNIKLQADTAERIREAARKLNYQPHSGARSIRSNTFNNLGYFVAKTGLLTSSPQGYMAGVHDVAEEQGYRMTMIRLPRNAEELENIDEVMPGVFKERNLDALVVESYSELAAHIYKRIQANRMPVVFVNDRHKTNSVYVDDEWGAVQVTQHLLERGYQRIGFIHREVIGGPTVARMHYSAADREKGYRKAMRAAGRKAACHVARTTGVVGSDVLLSEEDWKAISAFDAVVAYDDDLANLICRAAYDRDQRVPDHLAVAGFNGDYASLSGWRHLTTVRIPSYEMGRMAAEMALKLVSGEGDTTLPSIACRPELVVGQTT
ncbi:LacI family transcriptional regulator [Luteolibacter sp. LG18]|nr:LacI family transcriptional regulator [Luteolibacter sp. LG18]